MEDPLFHFNLLFDSKSGKLIGVISWWDATSFRFCEHFAISPDLRRRGYGARALKFLCNSPDRPVILEAEWPVDYISTLRVEFYLRNGFRGNPAYEHVHYAYHWWGAPHRMLMMSWPRKITLEEFLLFKRFNNLYPLSYSECNEAR